MHLVILAAGKNTRFKKKNFNKCLVKLNKQTLIERIIDGGLKQKLKIDIVTGHNSHNLKKKLKKYKLNYIYNKNFKKYEMFHSVICALKKINDDILFSYSDIIYNTSIFKKIKNKKNISLPYLSKWKKIWKSRNKNIFDDAETFISKNCKLIEIGKKISANNLNDINGQFMGIFYIPNNKRQIILKKYKRNEYFKKKQTTFILNKLLINEKIDTIKYNDYWYEFDDINDVKSYTIRKK